jgi:hypothetical protein
VAVTILPAHRWNSPGALPVIMFDPAGDLPEIIEEL